MLISPTRMADGATLATIGFGTSLTFGPAGAQPHLVSAPTTGVPAIGIGDLVLGALMLKGRNRSLWMAARAAYNVIIVGCYLDEFRQTGSRRAKFGATGMAALILVDGTVAFALRQGDNAG